MSLLGFLTGVGSLFKSGDKGSTSTSQSTNGSREQAQTGKTSLTAEGSASQNTSGTSSTTGSGKTSESTTSKGSQNTSQSMTGSQSGTQKGSVTGSSQGTQTGKVSETGTNKQTETNNQYSSQVLASIDSLLSSSLAGGGVQKATDAVEGRLAQIQQQASQPAFDVNSFVSGIASSAAAATQSDLDSRINSMLSATGSSESGNSMAALLGNRMRNDAAANLAGVVSNAQAQGQQILDNQQRSLTEQVSGLSGDLTNSILNLLQATRGAQSTTTGIGTSTNSQLSSQQQSQTQQEQSQQSQQQTQQQTQNQQTTQQQQQQSTGTSQQQQTTNESAQQTSTEKQKQDQESNQIGTENSSSTTKQNTNSKDGKNLFDRIADALGSSAKAA